MEKEIEKIRLIEKKSHHILYEFPLIEKDQAYQMASSLEEMGLEIALEIPSITENLSHFLGLSDEQNEVLKKCMEDEIESHQ